MVFWENSWTSGTDTGSNTHYFDTSNDPDLRWWYSVAHRCTIERIHARGSNALVRREYGECTQCGKPHRRIIDWRNRNARTWWEEI